MSTFIYCGGHCDCDEENHYRRTRVGIGEWSGSY